MERVFGSITEIIIDKNYKLIGILKNQGYNREVLILSVYLNKNRK